MSKRKKPFKVLLLSTLPPPVGGVASWSVNVLNYCEQQGIEYLFHLNTAIRLRRITDMSFYRRIVCGIWDACRIQFLFLKKVFQIRPRIVHVTTSASMGLFRDIMLLWTARLFSINTVFHFRFGRMPELSEANNWEWKLIMHLVRHSSRTVVIDYLSYQTLCKAGFERKTVLIPNPCSAAVEQIARKDILPKDAEHYIFVGHIVAGKGIYELVRAFSTISEDIKLTMIGPYENSTKDELCRIASFKNNGEWLNFVGSLSNSEVLAYMQTATAMVLPTYTEGFPNVVLEAMACGCPVLASGVASIPEMLNWQKPAECGVCFKSKSVEEVVRTLQNFRSDFLSHELYARNGKNKVLQEYVMDVVFPLYYNTWITIE